MALKIYYLLHVFLLLLFAIGIITYAVNFERYAPVLKEKYIVGFIACCTLAAILIISLVLILIKQRAGWCLAILGLVLCIAGSIYSVIDDWSFLKDRIASSFAGGDIRVFLETVLTLVSPALWHSILPASMLILIWSLRHQILNRAVTTA